MTRNTLAPIALSALLAACAALPPAEKPAGPVPPPSQPPAAAPVAEGPAEAPEPEAAPPAVVITAAPNGATRALQFFAQVKQKPQREWKSDYDALRKAYAASRTDYDRVRLALMLSLPSAPFADEAQALELLEPLARDDRNEFQGLAQLVSALLIEQRKRGSQAAALQHKLERIKALEIEMQQRAATPENRPR